MIASGDPSVLAQAVSHVTERLIGSYGLAAITSHEPGVIVVARKDSPLVVGAAPDGSYLASDMIALLDATRDVLILEVIISALFRRIHAPVDMSSFVFAGDKLIVFTGEQSDT